MPRHAGLTPTAHSSSMSCVSCCATRRFPTNRTNPRPGAPYGPEVRRVFDHMLAKAGRDGLPTRDYTGHVMEVVYPQENVETDRDIAFVDHLDVVPADDGWTHDAFDPQVIGDIVIGRGSLDNKGVALTSYFLLPFLQGTRPPFPPPRTYTVRRLRRDRAQRHQMVRRQHRRAVPGHRHRWSLPGEQYPKRAARCGCRTAGRAAIARLACRHRH